jgi:hypothetical protein
VKIIILASLVLGAAVPDACDMRSRSVVSAPSIPVPASTPTPSAAGACLVQADRPARQNSALVAAGKGLTADPDVPVRLVDLWLWTPESDPLMVWTLCSGAEDGQSCMVVVGKRGGTSQDMVIARGGGGWDVPAVRADACARLLVSSGDGRSEFQYLIEHTGPGSVRVGPDVRPKGM